MKSLGKLALSLFLVFASTAQAAISIHGSVSPDDLNAWNQRISPHALIGDDSFGKVNITDNHDIRSDSTYIGSGLGGDGIVTISGSNSTWDSFSFGVGGFGNGLFEIKDGSEVSAVMFEVGDYVTTIAPTTSGTVTLSGGSTLSVEEQLEIGFGGNGTINVTDGSTAIAFHCNLGGISSGNGTVNVSGNGSLWELTTLIMSKANGGRGELNVTDGGTVKLIDGCTMAMNEAGKAKITVSGSSSLFIGSIGVAYGHGELLVTNGGTADVYSCELACCSTGSGVVTVSGIDSTLVNEIFRVGYEGTGELNILFGGLVSIKESLVIDPDGDGNSFVNIKGGGMLALSGDVDESLDEFLGLVEGTDAIRYWDELNHAWAALSTATMGEDYTLEYLTEGDLTGYTVLTVGTVPEPGTLGLIFSGLVMMGILPAIRKRGTKR